MPGLPKNNQTNKPKSDTGNSTTLFRRETANLQQISALPWYVRELILCSYQGRNHCCSYIEYYESDLLISFERGIQSHE